MPLLVCVAGRFKPGGILQTFAGQRVAVGVFDDALVGASAFAVVVIGHSCALSG
ncbi:MAG: hypothetical protein P4L40_04730 [Terracidiphilus sp.]|nr:hypothetical protein [Terracidiphilus sp.]